MCASPISASDEDLIRLFEASRQLKLGRLSVPAVQLQGNDLTGLLVRAVSHHLDGALLLAQANPADALAHAQEAVAAWGDAIRLSETERPDMTPLSAVYHFRMASRHADEYRTLARRSLLGWIGGAREKSRFLNACCLEQAGQRKEAIGLALDVGTSWSSTLPARLPGLLEIRTRIRIWQARTRGDAAPEEAEEDAAHEPPEFAEPSGPWILPLRQEERARCAFAAAILPRDGRA